MLARRPRRNRKSASIRALIEEVTLSANDFIFPLFLIEGIDKKEEIVSMPGIYRYSIDNLLKEAEEAYNLGIPAIAIFPNIEPSLRTLQEARQQTEKDLWQIL